MFPVTEVMPSTFLIVVMSLAVSAAAPPRASSPTCPELALSGLYFCGPEPVDAYTLCAFVTVSESVEPIAATCVVM